MDECIRNHESTKQQHPFSVNAYRIFTIFPCAIRKNINKLQSFYGKKAEGGIKEKNPTKYDSTSNQHEKYGKQLSPVPFDMADCKTIGKHYDSLKDASDPAEFNAAS